MMFGAPSPQNPHVPKAAVADKAPTPFPAPEELWRREKYLQMGFEQISAYMLASDPAIDWHKVETALSRGATYDQLMRTFT